MNNMQFDQKAFNKLKPVETEVVRAAAAGMTCKETATYLGINRRTVEYHRICIVNKLECGTIAGAVAKLIRGGII